MSTKLLLGTAMLGILGIGAVASAGAKERGSSKSPTPTAPSGASLDELAAKTTADLVRQDIAGIRRDVGDWKQASDPETAGALSFTIEQAVSGATLPESKLDGDNGSPVLRAFGMRVLQLEGRAPRLKLWAKAWRTTLPVLAAALETKAAGLTEAAAASGDTHTGTEADPVPDAATMALILAAVKSQDPKQLRAVADKVESLGFPEAAKDLRAMADMIAAGQATASPGQTAPTPPFVPAPPVVVSPPPALPTPSIPVPPTSSGSSTKPPVTSSAPSSARVAIAHKGEGWSQLAGRVLGSKAEGLKRWRELRPLNPTFTKTDKLGNPFLAEGDALNIPPSWPSSKETLPGVSRGPGKQPTIDVSGTVASGSSTAIVPSVPTAAAQQRMILVKKNEGVANVALRARGKAYTDADRKRLRDFNVPPFRKTADGAGLILNPGDKLRIPPEWPVAVDEVLGGNRGRPMTPRQLRAARIALAQKFGHDDEPARAALADFQRREKIDATGEYGPATALVLCERFGFVPTVPRVWGARERQNREGFARRMYSLAKRDPQRSDEFRRVARQAEGKAQ